MTHPIGLDSFTSNEVMVAVKSLCQDGTTIAATIRARPGGAGARWRGARWQPPSNGCASVCAETLPRPPHGRGCTDVDRQIPTQARAAHTPHFVAPDSPSSHCSNMFDRARVLLGGRTFCFGSARRKPNSRLRTLPCAPPQSPTPNRLAEQPLLQPV